MFIKSLIILLWLVSTVTAFYSGFTLKQETAEEIEGLGKISIVRLIIFAIAAPIMFFGFPVIAVF